jgi:hypothetical protein
MIAPLLISDYLYMGAAQEIKGVFVGRTSVRLGAMNDMALSG